MHCSKHHPYSINSSASSCIELGTESPSSLVLRLITNSYLVGNTTGKLPAPQSSQVGPRFCAKVKPLFKPAVV
jgi:hypothetical protein